MADLELIGDFGELISDWGRGGKSKSTDGDDGEASGDVSASSP